MRPSTIKAGEKVWVRSAVSVQTAYFVRRLPAQGGRQAVNYLRFPALAGMDDGVCEMSDYEVSRRVERAVDDSGDPLNDAA